MASVRQEFVQRLANVTQQFLREAPGAGHLPETFDGTYTVTIKDGQFSNAEEVNAKTEHSSAKSST